MTTPHSLRWFQFNLMTWTLLAMIACWSNGVRPWTHFVTVRNESTGFPIGLEEKLNPKLLGPAIALAAVAIMQVAGRARRRKVLRQRHGVAPISRSGTTKPNRPQRLRIQFSVRTVFAVTMATAVLFALPWPRALVAGVAGVWALIVAAGMAKLGHLRAAIWGGLFTFLVVALTMVFSNG